MNWLWQSASRVSEGSDHIQQSHPLAGVTGPVRVGVVSTVDRTHSAPTFNEILLCFLHTLPNS